MKDQFLIDLAPGWVLGFDKLQWVLGKVVKTPIGAVKTVAGARFRAVAFIASTKRVLRRCIHENEIQLAPEASEYIETMPETFRAWYRRHNRSVPAQEREAA